jgi:hypothetical protein
MGICVLHVAPHPDDESIPAVATLLALAGHGHRIVNLAVSLGRPGQHLRRGDEVDEACRRAGFELLVANPPAGISSGDDMAAAQERIAATVRQVARAIGADLVVSPSPHDRHHGHEVVGRGVRDAVRATGGPRWWMWSLWAELPLPTLYSAFDDALLRRSEHVLAAHSGELARNDYGALVAGRGIADRVLGAERVFGWGSPARSGAYAELFTEVVPEPGGGFTAGAPRALDPADPLPPLSGERPLGWWLDAESFSARYERELRRT